MIIYFGWVYRLNIIMSCYQVRNMMLYQVVAIFILIEKTKVSATDSFCRPYPYTFVTAPSISQLFFSDFQPSRDGHSNSNPSAIKADKGKVKYKIKTRISFNRKIWESWKERLRINRKKEKRNEDEIGKRVVKNNWSKKEHWEA